jgi:isocitrate/isopropylmalate dehydrogenase
MPAAKDRYQIVTLPGDGIGTEVTAQAVGVLKVAAEKYGVGFEFEEIQGGGEYYLAHGREWDDGSEARVDAADAILLGAVGAEDPETGKTVFTKPGQPYETSQLAGYAQVIGNRLRMQLYANHRPIKLFPGVPHKVSGEFRQVWKPENVDYVIVRENTEEAYTGRTDDMLDDAGNVVGRTTPLEVTRMATERVVRYAFKLAQRRKAEGYPGKVTCVTKSNIIGAHKYFEEIFFEVAKAEFPEIEADKALFDAFCMWQMRNPEWFDVVVAPNLVGDVISDNASTCQGGMGLAAGGNIGDEHGMFEPIHGSAPKHAGKDKVNPVAAVLSGAMMCDWLSSRFEDERLKKMALDIEAAVGETLRDGKTLTYDLGGSAKCSELGEALREAVAKSPKR